MRFRGIRRFFESFRNIITNLRKKPATTEKPSDKEGTSDDKLASPPIENEDLEVVKSGPTLPNQMAKDRIGIKPRKNHPTQMHTNTKILIEDDKSETTSISSRNLIGPEDYFLDAKFVETPKMVPANKLITNQSNNASQEDIASPTFEDVSSETNEIINVESTNERINVESTSSRSNEDGLKNKTSSNDSLTSSVSNKSTEVFQQQQQLDVSQQQQQPDVSQQQQPDVSQQQQFDDKSPSTPIKIRDEISSRADSNGSDVVVHENASTENCSSKVSLSESVASNDAELLPTSSSEASLDVPSPKLKSPAPSPRMMADSHLHKSESLKFESKESSTSSSSSGSNLKSSKSSLTSRDVIPKPATRLVTSNSMKDEIKTSQKLSDDYNGQLTGDDDGDDGDDGEIDDEVGDVGGEGDIEEEDSSARKTSDVTTPEMDSSYHDKTNLGVFCIKPANKSNLKFQNLPTSPTVDKNEEFDQQETPPPINSHPIEIKKDDCKSPILKPLPTSPPLKPKPSFDEAKVKLTKSPEVPPKPTFRPSESGTSPIIEEGSEIKVKLLKSPDNQTCSDKPQFKVPPVVPAKPKFTRPE